MYKPWEPKGFSYFDIIINVLVSFFCFIWINVLWVYGHCTTCSSVYYSFCAKFWRPKRVPALKGLINRTKYMTNRQKIRISTASYNGGQLNQYLRQYKTLNQCRSNVGPPSYTLRQHQTDTGTTSHLLLMWDSPLLTRKIHLETKLSSTITRSSKHEIWWWACSICDVGPTFNQRIRRGYHRCQIAEAQQRAV